MGTRSKGPGFWRKHDEAMAASGLKAATYCKKHGLTTSVFYKWHHRFRTASKELPSKVGQLVPVEVVASNSRGGETSFRASLPTLGVVEICGDFRAVVKIIQLLHGEAV